MKRYAIYYAPPPGPLADFGAAWLGWDPVQAVPVPHPDIGLPVGDLTATPRKYGLHATLKAPFQTDAPFKVLDQAAAALARDLQPVTLDGLVLADLAGFLALRPLGDLAALQDLAARIVTGLDHLRAPLTPDEIARRNPDALPPCQREMLEKWGYPHVLAGFRFHITLTGSLPGPVLRQVKQALRPLLAQVLPVPFQIRDICLFGERQDGRFQLMRRYALGHDAP